MTRPIFGVDLAEQMTRDNVELPVILEKCCAPIEKYGLGSQCIYRINSMVQKAASLKEHSYKGSLLDSETHPSHLADVMPADMDSVNLDSEEWISDINNATNVPKMCLRELPYPLCINIRSTPEPYGCG